MVLKSLGLIQTVVFDELLDGAICQPALDEVVAQGGEVAALLGGDAILLRAELSVNVAAALGLVDGEDGLIDAEALHFACAQCGADGGIVVVLTEGDAILPSVGVEGVGVEVCAVQHALVDHGLDQSTSGGGAGGDAHDLVLQVSQTLDAGGVLHQNGNVVGIVGGGEVPGLLALFGDGEGSQNGVDVAGVQQLAAGGGGNCGELNVHAEVLCDHLCEAVLEALVLAGEGILEAEALNCVLDAHFQDTAVHDGLSVSAQCCSGSGRAAGGRRCRRGCGGACRAAAGGQGSSSAHQTSDFQKITTRDLLHQST